MKTCAAQFTPNPGFVKTVKENMREEKIRSIAICVCRNGDRILVAEGHDSKKGQTFYRPLGGTIEFGERGDETVRREFHEELAGERKPPVYPNGLLELFGT